jgi:hypothetical protein
MQGVEVANVICIGLFLLKKDCFGLWLLKKLLWAYIRLVDDALIILV